MPLFLICQSIIARDAMHCHAGRSVEVVQQTKSIEGAKMVARFFQKMNDYNSAIKFLILSNCHDEAFQLANQHSKMELYGEILANTLNDGNARKEDFKSLAIYFESQKNSLLAGKYYFFAREFPKVRFETAQILRLFEDKSNDFLFLLEGFEAIAESSSDNGRRRRSAESGHRYSRDLEGRKIGKSAHRFPPGRRWHAESKPRSPDTSFFLCLLITTRL